MAYPQNHQTGPGLATSKPETYAGNATTPIVLRGWLDDIEHTLINAVKFLTAGLNNCGLAGYPQENSIDPAPGSDAVTDRLQRVILLSREVVALSDRIAAFI